MSIKHSLLALLADGPYSASQLQQQFSDRTRAVWPLNIGQVTQTLGRLERDGLIEVAGTITGANNRPADAYQLTPAGADLLTEWWTAPVHRPSTERDELVIKVSLAAHNPAIDLIALLDQQRRSTIAQLRELNRASRHLDDTRTADRLQVERRIFDLEAEARWLDRVEALTNPTLKES
ncbi:PadR family transcriptional regulator [Corynebacterium sp.]|uniref:PadR family transcriptional regulator n=1 Tax=Corynebacterium sp. TaxID=1720 RepID=UPI0026DFF001|nr:PadR family transcriptional regulator [Corynebacterium sp.]MDO5513031.1 PadR family transcriptional regulator [Corynebacterium sp.]